MAATTGSMVARMAAWPASSCCRPRIYNYVGKYTADQPDAKDTAPDHPVAEQSRFGGQAGKGKGKGGGKEKTPEADREG